MSKHTPGPWRTEYETRIESGPVVAGKGWRIAEVGRDPESGDWRCNARLIAAAPELLNALKAFVSPSGAPCKPQAEDYHRAYLAIAKAEGLGQ